LPKISIVIPTRNEEVNINRLLLALLKLKGKGYNYEAVVVDDSDDATPIVAKGLGATVIIGQRKGLGQAILDGIVASSGEVVVVMDADLSHAPASIPELIQPILELGYDMTIGSRYVKGGSIVGWTAKRKIISKVAGILAFPVSFIRDNTSGFFAVKKEITEGVKLKADSWKIMLEILIRCNPVAVKEVPICFKDRQSGESKFTFKEVKRYLFHLCRLAVYKYQAILKFGTIGASGAGIHFLLLYTLTDYAGLWYIASAIASIVLASTWNYFWNHRLTFTDRHISNHIIGWTKYQFMSAITDLMYLGMLAYFVEIIGIWYMLGAFIAVIIIFPVKFIVASSMIWSKKIDTSDADYEWNAFYRGSLIQKWWKRKIASTVWEWIPKASTLLDIGCGSSPIISHYSGHAIGLDTNLKKVSFMTDKYPRMKFYCISSEYTKGEFDNVLCIEVLEHGLTPGVLISDIARLLKDGGRAVIATPDYSKLLWHIAERFTPYKEDHVTKLTRPLLEQTCQRVGLYPIKHKYVAGCDLVELFEKRSRET
jgi:dolichol-phosphate mannosyltransferase